MTNRPYGPLPSRLIEQLLEPFAEHDKRRVVVYHDLHGFALEQQQIAQCRIARAVVQGALRIFLAGGGSACITVNVRPAAAIGKTDRREHRERPPMSSGTISLVALVISHATLRAAHISSWRKCRAPPPPYLLFRTAFQLAEGDGSSVVVPDFEMTLMRNRGHRSS